MRTHLNSILRKITERLKNKDLERMWNNEVSWRFAALMCSSSSNFQGHNFQGTNTKHTMSLKFLCPSINVNIRQKSHCCRILRILKLKQYVNKCGYNDRLVIVFIPTPPSGIRSPIEPYTVHERN
jgi:hypothetical protein